MEMDRKLIIINTIITLAHRLQNVIHSVRLLQWCWKLGMIDQIEEVVGGVVVVWGVYVAS